VAGDTLVTSMHCSIASTNADGSSHVTPIGSLMLGGTGAGLYFDVFNTRLAANVGRDSRVTILVVNSGRITWLRALATGELVTPPGIRLIGRVGPPRASTDEEIERFHRFVGPLRHTRGGTAMWAPLTTARDVEITRIQNLNMGSKMRTAHA
jgi:hypothetical protein